LETLLNLCESNNISLNLDRDKLIDLTDFAVEGRYSVILDDIGDTAKYIEAVEQLGHDVTKQISNQINN